MKAVLVSNAVVFRRTHDLENLAHLLVRQGIELPLPLDLLRRFSPFAVTFRYEDLEITLDDSNYVVELMADVRAWVGRQIYE